MKTIIAGSRNIWLTTDMFSDIIEKCPWQITEVVSGTAIGVDTYGENWAKASNIPIRRYPANWDKHGKKAGIIRNIEMAEYAEALFAIWDGESKGTKHMIEYADKNNMPEIFIYYTNTHNTQYIQHGR
jgi:hypothetical protein